MTAALYWGVCVGFGCPAVGAGPAPRRQPRPSRAIAELAPRVLAVFQERPGLKGAAIARRLGVPFNATFRGVLSSLRRAGQLAPADPRRPGYHPTEEATP